MNPGDKLLAWFALVGLAIMFWADNIQLLTAGFVIVMMAAVGLAINTREGDE